MSGGALLLLGLQGTLNLDELVDVELGGDKILGFYALKEPEDLQDFVLVQYEELEGLSDGSCGLEILEEIADFLSLSLDYLVVEESEERDASGLVVEALGLEVLESLSSELVVEELFLL